MGILIALVIAATSSVATKLYRRAQPVHARTSTHPAPASVNLPSASITSGGSRDGLAWSALDDRQLTRF